MLEFCASNSSSVAMGRAQMRAWQSDSVGIGVKQLKAAATLRIFCRHIYCVLIFQTISDLLNQIPLNVRPMLMLCSRGGSGEQTWYYVSQQYIVGEGREGDEFYGVYYDTKACERLGWLLNFTQKYLVSFTVDLPNLTHNGCQVGLKLGQKLATVNHPIAPGWTHLYESSTTGPLNLDAWYHFPSTRPQHAKIHIPWSVIERLMKNYSI